MRLTVLAFDQSLKHTGWAVFIAPGEPASIKTGSFSCGKAKDSNAAADLFAITIKRLASHHHADFFAWERAKPHISAYGKKHAVDLAGHRGGGWTVNAAQLILPELQGIIRGAARAYGKPYASAYPSTWRAAVIGGGAGKFTTTQAKAAAKRHCRMLHIRFANEHEAEAACIALWAASSPEFKLALDAAKARAT
ncbi:MAG: hypothetical protein QM744_14465 [Mesorhizobium sp.]